MALPGAVDREFGQRLRGALRGMFAIIHRRSELPDWAFDVRLGEARASLLHHALTDVPATRASQNMAARFRKHGKAYFEFITTPGVAPTNNLAEQAIRFVVIDRRITQGTRGEKGRRWCHRICPITPTPTHHALPSFHYLINAPPS